MGNVPGLPQPISQLPVTRHGDRGVIFRLVLDRLAVAVVQNTARSPQRRSTISSWLASTHLWPDGRLPCRASPSPESAPASLQGALELGLASC